MVLPMDGRWSERIARKVTSKWWVGPGSTAGFILAILILIAIGALSYSNIRRISRNEGWVVHTHEVLDEIREVLATLANAESSQRSYLITGEQTYLEPYRIAAASVDQHVSSRVVA